MHVNVITYNMGMGVDDRDEKPILDSKQDAFDLFTQRFCEEFKKDPDTPWFICVQEINRNDDKTHPSNQVEGMQDRLKEGTSRNWYKNSSTPYNFPGQKEAVAIFSNYDLENKAEWELPGTGVMQDRRALAVDVQIPWGKIGVVVTHLIRPSKDEDGFKRIESIQQILTKINSKFGSDIPVILCGDMNVYDTTSAKVYSGYGDKKAEKIFENTIGAVLKAGYTRGENFASPPAEAITHHAWDFPPDISSNTWGILDYILVREVSCITQYPTMPPLDFFTTEDDGTTAYASDHKGMHLTINPGNIEWGKSSSYDTGSTLAVALDNNGNVVEVHRGASKKHKEKLYCKVGTLDVDNKKIDWVEHDEYKNDGYAPAVALDNSGNVVEVHCDYDDKYKHYYKVGMLNDNKTITWKDSIRYNDDATDIDKGSKLAVAMDNGGNIIEMHCGSDNEKNKLSYMVGKLNSNQTITWKKSTPYTDNYVEGSLFAVAMDNNGHVIGVHCGNDGTTCYRVGTLNDDQTITWGGAIPYGNADSAVAVALNDNGKVVSVYCGSSDSKNRYYYMVGTFNGDRTITWEKSIPIDYNTGSSFAVALNNSGNIVEVHRGGTASGFSNTDDTHFYHVGRLITDVTGK